MALNRPASVNAMHNVGDHFQSTSSLLPINTKEQSDVEMLTRIMPTADESTALRVLRKHRGDIERAAAAILEGDTGEAPEVTYTAPTRPASPRRARRAGHGTPVLNHPGEDDELARALQASLESVQGSPHIRAVNFGPSTRAPDPTWAMVPSNMEIGGAIDISHEDRTLQRVMQESLDASYSVTAVENRQEYTLEEQVRLDDRPVALRVPDPSLAYAALLVHGLFFVPQVRARVAAWRPSQPPGATKLVAPHTGPEHTLWLLLENFANMDLVYICELQCTRIIEALGAKGWDGEASATIGDLARQLLMEIAKIVEPQLTGPDHSRLLSFCYGNSTVLPEPVSTDPTFSATHETLPIPGAFTTSIAITPSQDTCIVDVDLDLPLASNERGNDLISRLSWQLSYSGHSETHIQQVIIEPSEVVTFRLHHGGGARVKAATPARASEIQPFRYPKHIYLDQFLASNAGLARERRLMMEEFEKEIVRLKNKSGAMRWFKGSDTLKQLRSSIYYYEHVAQSNGDPERETVIKGMPGKLKPILASIEEELVAIDAQIAKLQTESVGLLDVPELQQYRYDLRVVFMHDGLFGIKQVYSYVQSKGRWWKTADNDVTEVSEELVLTDTTGSHLGAGPYLLMYSRALSEDELANHEAASDWPELLLNTIGHNNEVFLQCLTPELQARFRSGDEPPELVDSMEQGTQETTT